MINILVAGEKVPPIRVKVKVTPLTYICKQRYFSNPFAISALVEGEWSAG
jgi:hypothetical protein